MNIYIWYNILKYIYIVYSFNIYPNISINISFIYNRNISICLFPRCVEQCWYIFFYDLMYTSNIDLYRLIESIPIFKVTESNRNIRVVFFHKKKFSTNFSTKKKVTEISVSFPQVRGARAVPWLRVRGAGLFDAEIRLYLPFSNWFVSKSIGKW